MAAPSPPLAKRIGWRAEAAGFDLFARAVRALPVEVASSLGGRLLRALGPLTGAHRTALGGLRIAFPQLSAAEREQLARAQWESFGRYFGEFPILDRLTPASGRVEVVGAERLAAIALSRRPVVFVSGHFANMEIMAAVIMDAGIDCDITYRAANNPLIDARIKRARAGYGVRILAPKGADGARELLAALGEGRSVAIMNDQKYDGGVEGVFFGMPVKTNPAAARLALRFGTVIQPMSARRLRGARFQVIAHSPIEIPASGDRAADIARGVAAINAFIEARVRERPAEWWWMHRRWPREAYEGL